MISQWQKECDDFGEEFIDFAPASLPALAPFADELESDVEGVYACFDGSNYHGALKLNLAHIAGYQGKVLRSRHMVFSPRFDFDEKLSITDYTTLLTELVLGVLAVSDAEMSAPHVKFHFRSPAEKSFFNVFAGVVSSRGMFKDVAMRGTWLYISK